MVLAVTKSEERLRSLPSTLTFTPTRSQRGTLSWKQAADSFSPCLAGAAIDRKSAHAKLDELTLENRFLEGALNKAGWFSARR